MDFKTPIAEILNEFTNLGTDKVYGLIEVPPKNVDADFAFPCFSLAKIKKKKPQLIATEMTEEINKTKKFNGEVIAAGPYINFKYAPSFKAEKILTQISENPEKFTKSAFEKSKPERIVQHKQTPTFGACS
jgi:arginyl-tRNA synthetase